jgi:RNA polymerase sigma factor (sigma-70 family)
MDTCHPGASVDAHPIDATTGEVDEAKLERLLVEVKRLAHKFSRRLALPDDREDLEQDTVLACLVSVREGTWNGHVAPLWVTVRSIMRYQAVTRLRRRQRSQERDVEYTRDVLDTTRAWMSPELTMRERELDRARLEMFDGLSPKCRQAYQLVREKGLTYAEAGQLLGMSTRRVNKFVVKAQSQLRKELERRGIEVPAWARREASREAPPGGS